jgi:hypothetical protein
MDHTGIAAKPDQNGVKDTSSASRKTPANPSESQQI